MTSSESLVSWSDAYSLGLPEIDDQHKVLIDLINQLWAAIIKRATPAETLVLVEELEKYTISHFGAEETFMRITGYPEFDRHKKFHDEFVARIASEKKVIQAGGHLSLELLKFLRDWLINHILVADKAYAEAHRRKNEPQSILGRFFKKLIP